MANHSDLIKWQKKIDVLRAMNGIDPAPADVKKEAGDRIKQLETAVTKFNACYSTNYQKTRRALEEQSGGTASFLKDVIEEFDRLPGATNYKKAIVAVDAAIRTMADDVATKKKAVETAEKARDEQKQKVAAIEPALKGVETLCDDLGKWGADVAKARKEAEAIPIDQRPIEAWSAISRLQAALAALDANLAQADPAATQAATLNTEMNNLETLLKDYREKGRALDTAKAARQAAEDDLAAARQTRADSILLVYEALSNAPPDEDDEDDEEEEEEVVPITELDPNPVENQVGAAGDTTAQTANEAISAGDIN
ncbi:protein of unknown function [Candidatus Promineifilum breve]|uniref:Uncharacterized protein n=1 Tax=Candidatus Promineifilum breve TaxID=1806508 RepID=A0A160T878_9CHLR|nr:hypothetical protein [Candidatus Promineifilum breve]CUS06232.1 protein of unknown function [Candidatus Promineifilum breve]